MCDIKKEDPKPKPLNINIGQVDNGYIVTTGIERNQLGYQNGPSHVAHTPRDLAQLIIDLCENCERVSPPPNIGYIVIPEGYETIGSKR